MQLRPGRQLVVALGLRDAVLPNLVKQRLVADLQQRGRLFAVPVGFIKCFGNGFGLGAILGAAGQRFKPAYRVGSILRRRIKLGSATVSLGTQFVDGQFLVPKHQIPLDEVAQFAQVAGPGILHAGLQQLW